MADHRNLPHTLLFESQSPSGSKFDENGYGELQNTSVFDDTMVVDSPLDEMGTQLEDVCFDAEVVDHFDDDESIGNLGDLKAESLLCELDTEIVLDSEDEGICKTMNQRTPERSERNALGLRERQIKTPNLDSASIDEQSRAGNKGLANNLDTIDGKNDVPQLSECDHETGRLECADSQEPEELSQANALSFVDNFLTFNDMDMCREGEERTSSRKKSPLVSSAKATQRLAKIIKGGSPVKRMGTFDWFDSNQHGEADSLSRMMTASSEYGDFDQRTDKSLQNPNNGEKSLRNKYKEKNEIAVLHKDIRGPSYSPSNFIEQGAKVRISVEQESERNIMNGSVKELDEFMQTEPSWEKFEGNASARDIPDMFDVGIGTQIAAEAMEALFYGPPPTWKTGDECERREDNIADLPDCETEKRANLDQHSLQNIAASDFGDIAKQSIRRKRSSRRYSKVVSSSSWKCNYQELNQKIKPKPCKSRQSKVNKNVSSNNQEKCESYASAPISDKDLGIFKSRHLQVGASMKGTKDQPDKPRVVTNNVEERSMLTYKRKRKRVVADPPKLLSGKQKCSKLYSNASAEASNYKLNKQGQINHQKDALARYFRLDAWKCPKGKRTHRKVPIHSSGASNKLESFTSVGADVHEPHSLGSQKVPEDDENASNNLNKKGLMRTALTQLSLENNSEEGLSRQSCNEEVTGIVTNKDSAVTNSRMSAWDLDRSKAIQTGQPGHADTPTIINGLESHIFENSQRKIIDQAGTECYTAVSCTKKVNEASFNSVSYVYRRRPCNKNLPKPSLLKELTGLVVPESISNFTRIRTRRQGAYVRVLFSQHLPDDIIKQQKKIAGRLGVSITSCSMDATHFIADEFVRTRNMLEAIALGKPVVTHLWLDSCGLVSCLLDEKNYILRDSKREKEIGFSMPVSLARARLHPLLKDKRVCITPNVKPNKEMITILVKAVGGQVVETSQKLAAKDQKILDNVLILSCEEDLAICLPLLDKGAAVYSSELLLNGIVIQKLEHERHKLFSDFVKRKRTISERDRQTRRLSKR
ncbi:hypothetical protein CCACVL1_14780 [Corchorus capsularis]|uniref:BRCT domain-containing protein n=1 Tax=Corchorus capsularis TaxID=210143 RepID=A0A1R3I5K4_COCAP|nr:hypothetical protein CCACVL1_14780 [Corchorus capsularis]